MSVNAGTTTTTSPSTGTIPSMGQVPNTTGDAKTSSFYGQNRPTYAAPTSPISAPITSPSAQMGNVAFGTGFDTRTNTWANGTQSLQHGVYGSDNANFSTLSMGEPIQRNYGGWGASYYGPVARVDNTVIGNDPNNGGFNQLLLNLPPTFEKLIQQEVLARPRFWHDRIPRGAFRLFNGTTGETNIFRGAMYKFAGLDEWSDIDPVPTNTNNPCGSGSYDTIKYGWERLMWSGKKAYWGSDPICLDALKFSVRVQEQLAMILSAGAEYGIQMQEVWNRDMFIYQSVLFSRSFVMSTDFYGPTDSPRYFYNPFTKFQALANSSDTADGVVNSSNPAVKVRGPFVVVDASAEIEPVNFDVLEQVKESLKIRCPGAAVSNSGGSPMFAIAMSADDVERYIRGNEEERRYWIEHDPAALIRHYGFAPNTFRGWIITNDGNQRRFKAVDHIEDYDPAVYGGVGQELAGRPVDILEYVPPQVVSKVRVGIGGSPIPEDNPEYYRAEYAIAPIFMNQVFTNLFVPTVSTLGSGTYFGPVTGLNGKWGWTNFRDSTNPEGNVGKFFGKFEIVPRPETHVFHCTSFLYRRCTTPMRSVCPTDNKRINPDYPEAGATVTVKNATIVDTTDGLILVRLSGAIQGLKSGAVATIGGTAYTVEAMRGPASFVVKVAGVQDSDDSSSGDEILSSWAGQTVTVG